jgi:hypothetical protein
MIYCLFEQSGTFKNVFLSKGLNAVDIDISNEFNQTDIIANIFDMLDNGFINDLKDDKIIAFFPCTFFSDYNKLFISGKSNCFRSMNKEQIKNYIINRRITRYKYKNKLYQLIRQCNKKHIPLIIENPVSLTIQQYLGMPTIKHARNKYGDYYKKPTVYYCYNCTINNNKLIVYNDVIMQRVEKNRGIKRSIMSEKYVENIINAIEW